MFHTRFLNSFIIPPSCSAAHLFLCLYFKYFEWENISVSLVVGTLLWNVPPRLAMRVFFAIDGVYLCDTWSSVLQ